MNGKNLVAPPRQMRLERRKKRGGLKDSWRKICFQRAGELVKPNLKPRLKLWGKAA